MFYFLIQNQYIHSSADDIHNIINFITHLGSLEYERNIYLCIFQKWGWMAPNLANKCMHQRSSMIKVEYTITDLALWYFPSLITEQKLKSKKVRNSYTLIYPI